MNTVRKLAEVGHRVRKDLKLKVRQPLNKVSIRAFNEMEFGIKENMTQYIDIISAELNVKKVELQFDTKSDDQILINLDTELTPELKLEGELRDIIREIQLKRKELGLGLSDGVDIIVPKKFASFEDIIRAAVLSRKIKFEEILSVEKSQ
jgi:isoleucyl-tRNA synthetase